MRRIRSRGTQGDRTRDFEWARALRGAPLSFLRLDTPSAKKKSIHFLSMCMPPSSQAHLSQTPERRRLKRMLTSPVERHRLMTFSRGRRLVKRSLAKCALWVACSAAPERLLQHQCSWRFRSILPLLDPLQAQMWSFLVESLHVLAENCQEFRWCGDPYLLGQQHMEMSPVTSYAPEEAFYLALFELNRWIPVTHFEVTRQDTSSSSFCCEFALQFPEEQAATPHAGENCCLLRWDVCSGGDDPRMELSTVNC